MRWDWERETERDMRDWDEMRSWGQMDNAPSVHTLFIIYLISIVHGIFLLARAMVVFKFLFFLKCGAFIYVDFFLISWGLKRRFVLLYEKVDLVYFLSKNTFLILIFWGCFHFGSCFWSLPCQHFVCHISNFRQWDDGKDQNENGIFVNEMMVKTKTKMGWKLQDQNETFQNTRTKMKTPKNIRTKNVSVPMLY